MSKKVILNKCFGGFGASYLAHKLYAKKKFGVNQIFAYEWQRQGYKKFEEEKDNLLCVYSIKDLGSFISHEEFDTNKDLFITLDSKKREDETFVEVVEELGKAASDSLSELVVVEIPDEVAKDYVIDDYDGVETLHQRVQEW